MAKGERKASDEVAPFATRALDYPAADPVLGLVDSRDVAWLDGNWQLVIDPMGVGDPGSPFGGFTIDWRTPTGMELIEFNFDEADAVRVPGDVNTQDERLLFYQGRVWYQRGIDHTPTPGRRVHLWFGGANFDTCVFLNGAPVGRHRGGYVPFSWDVTDLLRAGHNDLVVRVDNRLSDTTVPTARTDWWPYGGLTRSIGLVSTPEAFIRNARIALVDLEQRELEVEVHAVGLPPGATATVELPELGATATVALDDDGHGKARFHADVALWSPDDPQRHRVVFSAGDDRLEELVGFRTIATRGSTLLLNGEPVRFRGISTHEEPIGEQGVMHSEAQVRRVLAEAQALGVNFVRAAHYPYNRHMARVADELGLMLWAEVPVYWNIAWEDPDTLALARDQLGRMVARDWNRASVVVWSVANETPNSDARLVFLKQLIDDARTLDGTRLVSAALLGGGRQQFTDVFARLAARGLARDDTPEEARAVFEATLAAMGDEAPGPEDGYTVEIDDPLAEHVDLVGYNQYWGWYYSRFFALRSGVSEAVLRPLELAFMRDLRIAAAVDKPVHISEFGAGARAGRRDPEGRLWSEEYQAAVYEAQLAMLGASPQVQGISPWILKDFRAMLRTLPGVQDWYNRKGLIDPDGQRKLAFEVVRSFYEEW